MKWRPAISSVDCHLQHSRCGTRIRKIFHSDEGFTDLLFREFLGFRISGSEAVLHAQVSRAPQPIPGIPPLPNCIEMDCASGGSLKDAIKEEDGTLHNVDPVIVLRTSLRGPLRQLVEMHAQGAAHRDLKLSNVVIGEDGGGTLIDFSHMLRDCTTPHRTATRHVGTTFFRAPELCLVHDNPHPVDWRAADVWSFGIMIVGAVCPWYYHPTNSDHHALAVHAVQLGLPVPEDVKAAIKDFPSPSLPSGRTVLDHIELQVGRDLVGLLRSMLCFDPSRRITARQALDHPFWNSSQPVEGSCLAKASERWSDTWIFLALARAAVCCIVVAAVSPRGSHHVSLQRTTPAEPDPCERVPKDQWRAFAQAAHRASCRSSVGDAASAAEAVRMARAGLRSGILTRGFFRNTVKRDHLALLLVFTSHSILGPTNTCLDREGEWEDVCAEARVRQPDDLDLPLVLAQRCALAWMNDDREWQMDQVSRCVLAQGRHASDRIAVAHARCQTDSQRGALRRAVSWAWSHLEATASALGRGSLNGVTRM